MSAQEFHDAVAKIAGPNPSIERRQGAIRQVARSKPELYQAYLLATNPGRTRERLITEKLERVVD